MKVENLYVSSIDENAVDTANVYGLGLEIAEFCTAANMDSNFSEYSKKVSRYLERVGSSRFTFHGPFNELSPAAIDPLVLEVTKKRYLQAIELAKGYGIERVVIHSGFTADMYYPIWFEERSVEFWKDFLSEHNGSYEILYENVFEKNPSQLLRIVEKVGSERFRLCFDIGHANVITESKNIMEWLIDYSPYISHFHLHNNHGERDEHGALFDGNMDMVKFLEKADELCPNATYTLEIVNSEPSVKWLFDNGLIK